MVLPFSRGTGTSLNHIIEINRKKKTEIEEKNKDTDNILTAPFNSGCVYVGAYMGITLETSCTITLGYYKGDLCGNFFIVVYQAFM